MATRNYKNDNVEILSGEVATIPRATTGTGTIAATSVSVTIHGTGTLFLTDLKVGNWLCDLTNYEVRKIKSVVTDTLVIIDRPFSNALTTTAVNTVDTNDLVQEVFAVIKDGLADGVVDGKVMTNGVPFLWGRKSSIQISDANKVDPITFNATGTTITITTVR